MLVLILQISLSISCFSQSTIVLKSEISPDKSVNIYYTKTTPGTYTIYLNFLEYENTLTPQTKFVVNDYTGFLFSMKPINTNKYIRYTYNYNYRRGYVNPKIDSSFVYILPFKENKSIEVRFLTNLAKHFDIDEPETWKSFQFICHNADTVCSVRKGIVVKVVDNYSIDTTANYSYSSKRNLIFIEHKDGTFAKYSGFNGNHIFVKEGDIVFPNQPLGILAQYDKGGSFQLRFSIEYLKENYNKDDDKNKFLYNFINPFFMTSNGIEKLEARKKYETKFTDDLIKKELSKKELKKLK